MAAKTPRQRADACFAVARSTTFDGERSAAIERGLAICAKSGLDPATFDIPGRPRTKAAPPPTSDFRDDLFARTRSPFWDGRDISKAEIDEFFNRFQENVARATAKAEAQKAKFDNWSARRAKPDDRAKKAADNLFWLGVRVYRTFDAPDGSRRWYAEVGGDPEKHMTDDELIELDRRIALDIAQVAIGRGAWGTVKMTEAERSVYSRAFGKGAATYDLGGI